MIEPNQQALGAAHGETGYGMVFASIRERILLLDQWHDFLKKHL